jgi:hypothetical protein
MKFGHRLLSACWFALLVPLLWAIACSTRSGPDEGPLATTSEAVELLRHQQLTPCTSTCSGGLSCCAGFCATPANTSGVKLAFTSGNGLGYRCYQNAASDVVNPPANLLPDFSFAGYRRGGVAIPTAAPCGPTLTPNLNGDDTQQIQDALDACGAVATATAPRAVVLAAGLFDVSRTLWIKHDGVVLRGTGQAATITAGAATVLFSTRPRSHTLITIEPHALGDETSNVVPPFPVETSGRAPITTPAVPVGATRFTLGTLPGSMTLSPGDSIAVVRQPNNEWLADMGVAADHEGWRDAAAKVLGGGQACSETVGCQLRLACREGICVRTCETNSDCPAEQSCGPSTKVCELPIPTQHLRKVVSFDAQTRVLTIDIPIVDAIYSTYGGGYVSKIGSGRFIESAGVEDLLIDAQFEDIYPGVCPNGAATDTFCEKCTSGKACNAQSDCTSQGASCQNGVCACPPSIGGQTCPANACPLGTHCVDGVCTRPAPRAYCVDGTTICFAGDNDWNGIRLKRATNSWVRRVSVNKFGMSAVSVGEWSSFNTIEEVAHLDPKSPIEPGTVCTDCGSCSGENGGNPLSSHRYSFSVGEGIGNLFQRCYARGSRHTFVSGARGTGPHVWLDSVGKNQKADIGPHHRWATGLLFDNIVTPETDPQASCVFGYGNPPVLATMSVRYASGGHDWRGGQVMFWNNEATTVSEAPPAAMNWVVGGIVDAVPQSRPRGIWQLETTSVKPRSLYLEQLRARLGTAAVEAVTTKQQRARRIWDDLLRWEGKGNLRDYTADPDCLEGTPDDSSAACCPSTCAQCGSTSSLPQECRSKPIRTGSRSCLLTGAPCARPDPTCQWGPTTLGNFCCSSGCEACGSGSSFEAECRTNGVTRSCSEFPAPCLVTDPSCKAGLEGWSYDSGGVGEGPPDDRVCCNEACSQCGGPGCGAGVGCCVGSILADGGSCDDRAAPCVLE